MFQSQAIDSGQPFDASMVNRKLSQARFDNCKNESRNDESLKDYKQLYLDLFRARQRDLLIFSVIAFVFSSPIAIASIVFSVQALKCMKANNLERAAFLYNRSHSVTVFSMLFGGVCWLIWLIISIYLISI